MRTFYTGKHLYAFIGPIVKRLAATAKISMLTWETYPLVFQPFGGFGDDVVIENGMVRPPEIPGIGVEQKSVLYNKVLRPLIDG